MKFYVKSLDAEGAFRGLTAKAPVNIAVNISNSASVNHLER